jgi:purine-binding chemotaxis protein CheW
VTVVNLPDAPTAALLAAVAVERVCVVALGDSHLALRVENMREVVVFEDATPVPLAPPHVVGTANLRGTVVPIVDARAVLGLPSGPAARRYRTLMLSAGGLEAGLVIDRVVSLDALGQILPVDPEAGLRHAEWATGYLGRDNRLVPLIDAAKLLNALRPQPGTAA